ncbi:MAG: UpxY family transcription antiterminator [Prevotella ruminicola]|jgi:transcription antitermination factor NusG|uniref:UpxY family transcription antiterminator n=1 Tax=Xylanibacter ruminicola TaxID=839 RepID=A0A928BSL4_XYLRU|nr:UpxY family transcription antiterminator [Xylanibacter ruminicola]
MVEDNEIRWYAVGCTSSMKELKVRDDIRNYGLEAFVPLKYEIKTIKHQKHRALVPAIPGLMFAKGTLEELKEYIQDHSHYPVYLRKSTFSNKEDYLTVRTKEMEEFIAVTEDNEAHITYFRPEEINLQAGDRIRVKGGLYDGKEGIVMRIKGKRNKHLVVQIPGMLVAAIEMAPELVEMSDVRCKMDDVISEKPSKDVEGDKKLLFDYAHRVLFEINGRYKEDAEYYLLMSEIKRAKARLATFKGFTPATEAELALPMFMAAAILGEDVEKSRERLEKAIAKLKDTSKLKAKCLEIMQKCNNLKNVKL